jgi:hypothetical protein
MGFWNVYNVLLLSPAGTSLYGPHLVTRLCRLCGLFRFEDSGSRYFYWRRWLG